MRAWTTRTRGPLALAVLAALAMTAGDIGSRVADGDADTTVPLAALPGGPSFCRVNLGDQALVTDDGYYFQWRAPGSAVANNDLRLTSVLGRGPGTLVGPADTAEHAACTTSGLAGFGLAAGATNVFALNFDQVAGYTGGDCAYLDRDASGTLSRWDLRVTRCTVGSTTYTAGTIVELGDTDLVNAPGEAAFGSGVAFRFWDSQPDGVVDQGDMVYVASASSPTTSGFPSVNDIRLLRAPVPNRPPTLTSSLVANQTIPGTLHINGTTMDPNGATGLVTSLWVDGLRTAEFAGSGPWNFTWAPCAAATVGHHLLLVRASDPSTSVDTGAIPVSFTGTSCTPDYYLIGGPQHPAGVAQGTLVTVTGIVGWKLGAGLALPVALRVDGAIVSTTVAHIEPPGGQTTVSLVWNANRVGFHDVALVLDPDDVFAELREDNNGNASRLSVVAAGVRWLGVEPDVRPLALREGDVPRAWMAAAFESGTPPVGRGGWFLVEGGPRVANVSASTHLEVQDQLAEGGTPPRYRLVLDAQLPPAVAGTHTVQGVFILTFPDGRTERHDGPRVAFSVARADAPSSTAPAAAPTPGPTTGDALYVAAGSIALGTAQPLPGAATTVYALVVNPTRADTTARLLVSARGPHGEEQLGEPEVRLGAGQRSLVEVPWTPGRAGEYDLRVALAGGEAVTRRVQVGPGNASAPALVLSAGLLNIGAIDQGTERTVPVEVTAYNARARGVRIDVLASGGAVVEPLTPAIDIEPGQTVKYYLRVRVPPLGPNATLGNQRIALQAYASGLASNVESVDFVVHQEGFRGMPGFDAALGWGALAAGGGAAFFRRRVGGR